MMYIYGTWLDWFGLFVGVPLALFLAACAGWWAGVLFENWRVCRLHDKQMAAIIASRDEAWRALSLEAEHYRKNKGA